MNPGLWGYVYIEPFFSLYLSQRVCKIAWPDAKGGRTSIAFNSYIQVAFCHIREWKRPHQTKSPPSAAVQRSPSASWAFLSFKCLSEAGCASLSASSFHFYRRLKIIDCSSLCRKAGSIYVSYYLQMCSLDIHKLQVFTCGPLGGCLLIPINGCRAW